MDEVWITIKDFENYQVSNLGRIMSLYKNIILKPQIGTYYLHVSLYKNKKTYTKEIHTLVAKAFIPNPDNLPEINHIDGKKHNCAVSNLEWSTRSNNMNHAYRTGLLVAARGEKNGQSKLTDLQVKEIKELKGKIKGSEVAIMYDIDRSVIYNIFNNKAWKHI